MMLRRLSAAACVALAVSQPAGARNPLALEPSSHWELDYAEDSCALRRTFGEGQQQTHLEMRRFAPGRTLQTTVASNAKMTRRNFRYRFGYEAEWEEERLPLHAYFDNGSEGVIFLASLFKPPLEKDAEPGDWDRFHLENDVPALEAEAAAKIDSLSISRVFGKDILLKTGPLAAPIKALNECVDELIGHWGIDVEAHKTRMRSTAPIDMAKAVRMVGYPPKMLRKGLPGLVNIRLEIDETGLVTQCHIQMQMSDPEFEKSSCADIQHAFEFEPALDKDGRPMKSYYVTSVRFAISGPYYRY